MYINQRGTLFFINFILNLCFKYFFLENANFCSLVSAIFKVLLDRKKAGSDEIYDLTAEQVRTVLDALAAITSSEKQIFQDE